MWSPKSMTILLPYLNSKLDTCACSYMGEQVETGRQQLHYFCWMPLVLFLAQQLAETLVPVDSAWNT